MDHRTMALLESTFRAVLDDLKAQNATSEAMLRPDPQKLQAAKKAIEEAEQSLREDERMKGLGNH